MANILARILEKRIGKLFVNFHAGKNASSSLFKGEGTAVDLEFNKTFINSFLPLDMTVTRATCKRLKWRLSLVSKTPVSLVFSGVHIEVEALPPGKRRSAWAKKTKQRSKHHKESTSKKQAILQGVKLQFVDLFFKLLLLPEHGAMPFVQLDVEAVRMHSANSQWQEISDLSKVYVLNPAVGEAMSFKKLEVSGCSLRVYHPAANLSQSSRGAGGTRELAAAVLLDSETFQARLSTKRRCTDWEILAFKISLDFPHLACSLSRNEVFMIKRLVRALARVLRPTPDARNDGGGEVRASAAGGRSDEVADEDDEAVDVADKDGDEEETEGLDTILKQSAEAVMEEGLDLERLSGEDGWCSHVDNRIDVHIKSLQVRAVPEETGAEDGRADSGVLLLVTGFHVSVWPAAASLKKVASANRMEHRFRVGCEMMSLKETVPQEGETKKMPAHLSLIKPDPDSEGLPLRARGDCEGDEAASREMFRVTAHVPATKSAGPDAVIRVEVEVAALHFVWDADVCLRLCRWAWGRCANALNSSSRAAPGTAAPYAVVSPGKGGFTPAVKTKAKGPYVGMLTQGPRIPQPPNPEPQTLNPEPQPCEPLGFRLSQSLVARAVSCSRRSCSLRTLLLARSPRARAHAFCPRVDDWRETV